MNDKLEQMEKIIDNYFGTCFDDRVIDRSTKGVELNKYGKKKFEAYFELKKIINEIKGEEKCQMK